MSELVASLCRVKLATVNSWRQVYGPRTRRGEIYGPCPALQWKVESRHGRGFFIMHYHAFMNAQVIHDDHRYDKKYCLKLEPAIKKYLKIGSKSHSMTWSHLNSFRTAAGPRYIKHCYWKSNSYFLQLIDFWKLDTELSWWWLERRPGDHLLVSSWSPGSGEH